MTSPEDLPDDLLKEVSTRLVDDQEFMIIDPPDEVEPPDDEED